MKKKDRFEENLEKQLEMNKLTYARLLEVGLKVNSEVELDFCFVAPNEAQGLKLADSLRQDCDIKIDTGYSDENFVVQGTTKKLRISLDIINQWVVEMCEKGQVYYCLFDGWGTSI